MARDRGDLPDHQVRRGARDRRQIVMFGQPVAEIAEPVDMARQIDAVAQMAAGRVPVVTTERPRTETGIIALN
jgi:hypothetical protein